MWQSRRGGTHTCQNMYMDTLGADDGRSLDVLVTTTDNQTLGFADCLWVRLIKDSASYTAVTGRTCSYRCVVRRFTTGLLYHERRLLWGNQIICWVLSENVLSQHRFASMPRGDQTVHPYVHPTSPSSLGVNKFQTKGKQKRDRV